MDTSVNLHAHTPALSPSCFPFVELTYGQDYVALSAPPRTRLVQSPICHVLQALQQEEGSQDGQVVPLVPDELTKTFFGVMGALVSGQVRAAEKDRCVERDAHHPRSRSGRWNMVDQRR